MFSIRKRAALMCLRQILEYQKMHKWHGQRQRGGQEWGKNFRR